MYSQNELNKLRRSAPINFRLLLLNGILLAGCTFIVLESVKVYLRSLDDLDAVTKLAAAGNAPCGLAVPRTKFLLQSLKEISDDAFTEESEEPYVNRVRGAFCGATAVTDALRGQWAHQCGVQAGARLVSIDGTRLEGLDAAEIRLAASRASRPLWLDVQPGGHAPTGDALSGAHLLL